MLFNGIFRYTQPGSDILVAEVFFPAQFKNCPALWRQVFNFMVKLAFNLARLYSKFR